MHIYYLLSTGMYHSKSETYRIKIMEVRKNSQLVTWVKCKYRQTPRIRGKYVPRPTAVT